MARCAYIEGMPGVPLHSAVAVQLEIVSTHYINPSQEP